MGQPAARPQQLLITAELPQLAGMIEVISHMIGGYEAALRERSGEAGVAAAVIEPGSLR